MTYGSTEVALARPRLPMPREADVDPGQWKVLVEAIFPSARSPEAVMMALAYCKARNLDIFRRPVNIVPIWNAALGREVETVWPSINEIEVTAARTGAWAGLERPEFGPDREQTFYGRRKVRGQWEEAEVSVTFPEWCAVTVYRIVGGQRCPFTEPVYWLEAYGRVGSSTLPNDQWTRRPRGMIIKVGKAFSLRAAFPEQGEYVAEEVEGNELVATAAPVAPDPKWSPRDASLARSNGPTKAFRVEPDPLPPQPQTAAHDGPEAVSEASPDHDPDTGEIGPREIVLDPLGDGAHWRDFSIILMGHVDRATSVDAVQAWIEANRVPLEALAAEAPRLHARLHAAIGRRLVALVPPQEAADEAAQDPAPEA